MNEQKGLMACKQIKQRVVAKTLCDVCAVGS